jgi:DNA-binding NtrC family response regulator
MTQILLIEDEESCREIVQITLNSMGISIAVSEGLNVMAALIKPLNESALANAFYRLTR